jgi:hypothetical protein
MGVRFFIGRRVGNEKTKNENAKPPIGGEAFELLFFEIFHTDRMTFFVKYYSTGISARIYAGISVRGYFLKVFSCPSRL